MKLASEELSTGEMMLVHSRNVVLLHFTTLIHFTGGDDRTTLTIHCYYIAFLCTISCHYILQSTWGKMVGPLSTVKNTSRFHFTIFHRKVGRNTDANTFHYVWLYCHILESSGRVLSHVSHGPIVEKFSLKKCWGEGNLAKTQFFDLFLCPHQKISTGC